MGGAILLDYAHSGGAAFQRLAFCAPMIDLYGLRFPLFSRLFADTLDMLGLGANYIPGGGKVSHEHDFVSNRLTGDPRRFARNEAIFAEAPQLGVGDPTIGWANAAFRAMRRFADPEFPRRLRTPALILMAGREEVVSNAAIERFVQQMDLAHLVKIPGARHEMMMERDELRSLFFAAFDAFVPGGAALSRQT